MKSPKEAEKKFNEQLSRLRTDHIDYYLMHMLPDVKTWESLKSKGIDKWLEEKKENGQITNTKIRVFSVPLMEFAKDRKQITTISRSLLQAPVNQTDTNIRIMTYLIDRIAAAKRDGKFSNKILFSTLFKETDQTEKKQRQRAKQIVYKFLDHFTEVNYIKGYKIQPDGIEFTYEKTAPEPRRKKRRNPAADA